MPARTRSRQKKPISESQDESTNTSDCLSDSQEELSTDASPKKPPKTPPIRKNASESPASPPKSRTQKTSPSLSTPSSKPSKESTQPKSDSPSCCAIVMVSIFITVVGVLIAVLVKVYGLDILSYTGKSKYVSNSCPADLPICMMEKFKKDFKELKSNFKAQDGEFWKRIKVPVTRVIEEENPEYPAVLMFVVPKGENTSCTATCLAKKYISKLNAVYTDGEDGYINVQRMSSTSADDMKYQLDNEIKRVFDRKSHKLHTVVIDHIETLDPRVMLLFHGYCDGDHAPYKDAVIILVLHTDLDTEIRGNLDKVVDKYLLTLWKEGLDADKIPPLIARVANNKAMVQNENLHSFRCC